MVLLACPLFIQHNRSGKLLSQTHLCSSTPAWLQNTSVPGTAPVGVDAPCAQWSQGKMSLSLIRFAVPALLSGGPYTYWVRSGIPSHTVNLGKPLVPQFTHLQSMCVCANAFESLRTKITL